MKNNKVAIAVAALLASAGALAEESVPAQTEAEAATQLESMEVRAPEQDIGYLVPDASTGTKTDTPIMETPLNIQVISQEVLRDQNDITLEQALKNVSGVKSSGNYGLQESIYLRGFLTTTTFRNGFRIDDALGNGMRNMTNVESVEVLKGPAAILYGRVEPGGAVNLVTKKPQATPYYSAEQQAGSWDHYLTILDATGPVNEDKTLLYRINASYDTSNSWRDSVTNERLFIAPTLKWIISPQTQVTLEAEYNHNPNVYDAGQAVPYDQVSQQFVWLSRHKNLAVSDPMDIDTPYLGLNWSHQFNNDWSIKHQIMRHEVKATWDPFYYIADFTQVSPTSWTVDRARSFGDGRSTTTATVLDLTGHFDTAGLKHTLLLGADYYEWKTKLRYGYSSSVSTTDAFNPTPPVGVDIDPASITKFKSTTDNYGVYAQDQIELPGNVHVLGGLRYQKVTNNSSNRDASGVVTPDPSQSDHDVTPRVGILWQPRGWLSLYGNYAENFGANTGRDWQGKPLNPESAQQKEVGAKTEFFGGKLRTSLAYFDITKQNVATADLAHAADPACALGCSIAVGEVNSRGTELDIQGEIQPGWSVIATYAHTDIRITKSNNGDEGLRMPNVPQNMASLWTTYEFKQESLHGWKIGGGVNGYSPTTDTTNTIDTPGYALMSAMAAYDFKTGGHKVTAQLNINNLLDKTYYLDAAAYGNVGLLQYGTPRNAMASLRFEF